MLTQLRPFRVVNFSICSVLGLLLVLAQLQGAADRGEVSFLVGLAIAGGGLLLGLGKSLRHSSGPAVPGPAGQRSSSGFGRRDVLRLIAVLYWAALIVAYLQRARGLPFTIWLVASVSYACGACVAVVIKELRGT